MDPNGLKIGIRASRSGHLDLGIWVCRSGHLDPGIWASRSGHLDPGIWASRSGHLGISVWASRSGLNQFVLFPIFKLFGSIVHRNKDVIRQYFGYYQEQDQKKDITLKTKSYKHDHLLQP